MPRINLLPWREELRQKRKKEFLMAALGAVLMGAALTFGTKVFYQGMISNQQDRNNLLRAEIALLDQQIAEINELDAQKSRLLARMDIIERLQRSRPEAVHLMDELVEIVPEGTYLTEVTQQGNRIEIAGSAQSQTRISTLMRNIDDVSAWLADSGVLVIETAGSGPTRDSQFRVAATQVSINDSEGEL